MIITRDMVREAGRRLRSRGDLDFCAAFGCSTPSRQTLCLRCALYGAPGVPGIEPWEPQPDDPGYTPGPVDR